MDLERACMSRAATVAVASSMRSASVDLPWSMWAMIAKLRMFEAGVSASRSTAPSLVGGRRAAGGASAVAVARSNAVATRRRRFMLLLRCSATSVLGAPLQCYVRFRRPSDAFAGSDAVAERLHDVTADIFSLHSSLKTDHRVQMPVTETLGKA